MFASVCLVGISVYLISNSIMDLILGEHVKGGFLSSLYADVSGVSKDKKKVSKDNLKKFTMDKKVYFRISIISSSAIFFMALIFFRSFSSALIFSLAGFFYPKYYMIKKMRKRKDILNTQFKEALLSISNSLKAGNSLTGAVERCLVEMKAVYKKQIEKPMIDELELITYEMQVGKNITEALISFKDRVKLEDVNSFVNAAVITEKTGGNLTEVMSSVAEMISDKIEVQRELNTLTAGKRGEAKLLTFMPVSVVLILSTVAPSYMEPMYENPFGKILMIFGVILLIVNYLVGKKIINISV